jgi:hypothetical protein
MGGGGSKTLFTHPLYLPLLTYLPSYLPASCLLLSRGPPPHLPARHPLRLDALTPRHLDTSTPNPPPPPILIPSPHSTWLPLLRRPAPTATHCVLPWPLRKKAPVRVVRSTYLSFHLPPPTTARARARTARATTCIFARLLPAQPKPCLACLACPPQLRRLRQPFGNPMPALSCIPTLHTLHTLHSSSPNITSSNPLLPSAESRLAAVSQTPKSAVDARFTHANHSPKPASTLPIGSATAPPAVPQINGCQLRRYHAHPLCQQDSASHAPMLPCSHALASPTLLLPNLTNVSPPRALLPPASSAAETPTLSHPSLGWLTSECFHCFSPVRYRLLLLVPRFHLALCAPPPCLRGSTQRHPRPRHLVSDHHHHKSFAASVA